MPNIRYAGLSTMVLAEDMPQEREAAKAYVRDLAEQLEVACRTHVGGITPQGAPIFTMDGPVPRPDQSPLLVRQPDMVYVFTYGVPVDVDRLPADCTAYHALNGGTPPPSADLPSLG